MLLIMHLTYREARFPDWPYLSQHGAKQFQLPIDVQVPRQCLYSAVHICMHHPRVVAQVKYEICLYHTNIVHGIA